VTTDKKKQIRASEKMIKGDFSLINSFNYIGLYVYISDLALMFINNFFIFSRAVKTKNS
jgi:hypothetical protein